MITKIFLLCATLAQVSANPLLQALAQTCPICQQNALKDPLAAALPMLFQQPTQNQPYPQGIMPENAWPVPPSQPNVLPCPMCPPQNQFCSCAPNKCHNQPACPPQNARQSKQGNSDILNMLMSNPAIKSILDPNTKMFTQNGMEVPKNGMCNNGSPQVINNYIIVPPDLLHDNSKCIPKENKNNKEDVRGSNGERRRRPKQNNATREEPSNKSAQTDVIKDLKPIKDIPKSAVVQDEGNKPLDKNYNGHISLNGTERLNQRKRRRRIKNRNLNIKVQVVNETGADTNNQTETPLSPTTEKFKSYKNIILDTTTQTSTLEPTTTEHSQFYDKVSSEVIRSVQDLMVNKNSNVDKQVKEEISPVHVNANIETATSSIDADFMPEIQIQSPQESSTARPKQRMKKHQQTKNPREEAVIADFKNKFPNIPENVIRDLIDHMARQIKSQNLGVPTYFSQHPTNYKRHLGNHFNHEVTIPVYLNNKQNKYKNDNKRRSEQTSSKEQNIETTKDELDKESISTTEKPTTTKITTKYTTPIEETTAKPEIVTVTAKNIKEISTIEPTTLKPFEDLRSGEDVYTHEFENADKGANIITTNKHEDDKITEEMVPIFYVNSLDEYYPDFKTDNQFFSYEDYSYLEPEDERYYYTTDKSYSLRELNRERRKYESENVAKNSDNKFVFKVRENRRKRPRPQSNLRRRPVSRTTTTTTTTTFRPKIKSVPDRPKVLVTVEQSTEKTRETEEIQFKTPPTLENIDFETKPINKNFYFRDDDYKISTYSDFKTPQYLNNKDKSSSMKQKAADKIETVYAQSKVVKYGQTSDETFGRTDLVNETNLFSSEDKTIILAKSISGDQW